MDFHFLSHLQQSSIGFPVAEQEAVVAFDVSDVDQCVTGAGLGNADANAVEAVKRNKKIVHTIDIIIFLS